MAQDRLEVEPLPPGDEPRAHEAPGRPRGNKGVVFGGVVAACVLGVGFGLWARPNAFERGVPRPAKQAAAPKGLTGTLQIVVDDTPPPVIRPLETLPAQVGEAANANAREPVAAEPLPIAPHVAIPAEPVAPKRGPDGLMKVADPVMELEPVEPVANPPPLKAEPPKPAKPKVQKAKAEASKVAEKPKVAKAEPKSKTAKAKDVQLAKAEKAKAEKARLAKAEKAKAEARRIETAKAERAEKTAKAKREIVRLAKAVKVAAEKKVEAARLAKAEKARQEKARLAKAEKAKADKAQLAKAEKAKAEKARLAKLDKAKLDKARKEKARRAELARAEAAKPKPAPVRPRGEGPLRQVRNERCVSSDPGEALVCADPRLSVRERQMQRAMREAEAAGVPPAQLRRQHERWLAARAAAAREAPWAVEEVYEARIAELNDQSRGSGY